MLNTTIPMYSIDDILDALINNNEEDSQLDFVSNVTGISVDRLMEMLEKRKSKINTDIGFLYRDAENYKIFQHVIAKGIITDSEIDTIISSLSGGEYFIPEQLGLECERFGRSESDHCFCELCKEDIILTAEEPTTDITVKELVKRFEEAGRSGWDDVKYAIY